MKGLAIVSMLVAGGLTSCSRNPDHKEQAIGAAQALIKRSLIDPDSVQFRDVKYGKPTVQGGPSEIVCGEYNSKTRLGGYVGFSRFLYDVKSGELWDPNDERNFWGTDASIKWRYWSRAYSEICRNEEMTPAEQRTIDDEVAEVKKAALERDAEDLREAEEFQNLVDPIMANLR
ncbi:MAG: hypothetical protein FJ335_01070 [Sphingomonadales bacterium]|nr:hypothetical protein [Sphingomonadales bacterium]